ncbi:MAG: gliding motility-associated C-terminal domain-containing protein, partial [Bacteroidota bacterium]
KELLLPLLFLFVNGLIGQIDTVYSCNPGDDVQLNAPRGFFAYRWIPSTELDNPTIPNPIANPLEQTTYVVEIIPSAGGENLISNPHFSEGNQGFRSDYPYNDVINFQGVFGINESAANLNPVYFADCPDHTSGTGQMMVVDGSPISDQEVWCQTILVEPQRDYAFSAWLTSVNPSNPAELQFSINGISIGQVFRASNQVCDWRQFYEIWPADTNSSAEICIINQNTNPNGNDFALDDFSFFALDELRYDTTVVIVEALVAAQERRVYFPNAFSPNFDGINDYFVPFLGKGALVIRSFKIFNRWGDLIFEQNRCSPNDLACRWDGYFNDKPMPPGGYVYTVEILFAGREVEQYSGVVWLVK